MLDTYYLIRYWVDDKEYLLGPYIELSWAIPIMLDHLPVISRLQAKQNKEYLYKARLEECALTEQGTWETIDIKIEGTECYQNHI